jgi:hypothetical protein
MNYKLSNRSSSHITNDSAIQASQSFITKENNSNLKEYPLWELGFTLEPFSWSGEGYYNKSYNQEFDLQVTGSALLIINFTMVGDEPDSPGCKIIGYFNDQPFEEVISKNVLKALDSSNTETQIIAIALPGKARIFGNYLSITFEVTNEMWNTKEGTLYLSSESCLQVGDALTVKNNGSYNTKLYPNQFHAVTSITEVSLRSIFQIAIQNETFLKTSQFTFHAKVHFEGLGGLSINVKNEKQNPLDIKINETSSQELNITCDLQPSLGVNTYTIELYCYNDDLFSNHFILVFEEASIIIIGDGKSTENIYFPFFQWPSYPIVGIIILALWFLPFTILKYREWKKAPDELLINTIDKKHTLEGQDLFDPEGIASGDDDDIEEDFVMEEF